LEAVERGEGHLRCAISDDREQLGRLKAQRDGHREIGRNAPHDGEGDPGGPPASSAAQEEHPQDDRTCDGELRLHQYRQHGQHARSHVPTRRHGYQRTDHGRRADSVELPPDRASQHDRRIE
jgi:hypothetical protein